MSDANSWCTCRKKLPQGYDTSGCPVHDRDTEQLDIDDLSSYVKRITKAVNYKGDKDHEDVSSILRELIGKKK